MKSTHMSKKRLLVALGVGVGVMLMAACSPNAAPAATPTNQPSGAVAPVGNIAPSASGDAAMSRSGEAYGLVYPGGGDSNSGIWVTGSGQVSVKPDLAVVNVGVEAQANTVAEAREKAAQAMDAMLRALRANKVEDKDIQTQYFNITPRYTSRKMTQCDPAPLPSEGAPDGSAVEPRKGDCYEEYESIIVGYTVTNQLTVKLRNLEGVGGVIDQLTAAGGDLTRLNGIYFTVEDQNALQARAREAAVKDLMGKAQQFAELTGVKLGKLVYITETSYASPKLAEAYARDSVAGAPASIPTPIETGEIDVEVTVQGAFGIE